MTAHSTYMGGLIPSNPQGMYPSITGLNVREVYKLEKQIEPEGHCWLSCPHFGACG